MIRVRFSHISSGAESITDPTFDVEMAKAKKGSKVDELDELGADGGN